MHAQTKDIIETELRTELLSLITVNAFENPFGQLVELYNRREYKTLFDRLDDFILLLRISGGNEDLRQRLVDIDALVCDLLAD